MGIQSVWKLRRPILRFVLMGIFGLAASCVPSAVSRLHAALIGPGSGSRTAGPHEMEGGLPAAVESPVPSEPLKVGEVHKTETVPSVPPGQDRSMIFATGPQTFRVGVRDDEVWDLVLDLLLKNYALTVVDRPSGVISTEWDTYRKGQTIYRNKLTLRVRRAGRNGADLTVQNSLERLRDGRDAAALLGPLWLPEERSHQAHEEVRRIVHNLALVLGSAPPVFSPDWQEEPKLSNEALRADQVTPKIEYK